MNDMKPIIVGNYKPSGHGCGKIHHGGGYLILLLRFRKTTSLLSTSLSLSRESEPKQKNSEDICTEIREQSFLPDRWCQERTE